MDACVNGRIAFLFNTTQNKVYWDPGKRKVIADSVRTTTHIAITLPTVKVLSIYVNNKNNVGQNVHRGCTYE